MNQYAFVRAEGFYAVEYPTDQDAIAGALENPGTLQVINGHSGKVVWQAKPSE